MRGAGNVMVGGRDAREGVRAFGGLGPGMVVVSRVKLRCGACGVGQLDTLVGTAEEGVYAGKRHLLAGDRFWWPENRHMFARVTVRGPTYPGPDRFCRAEWPVRRDRLDAAFRAAVAAGVGEVVIPLSSFGTRRTERDRYVHDTDGGRQ
jgi:hypothetical protein